jgi:hypothetical protein
MKTRLGFLIFAATLFLLGPSGCSCKCNVEHSANVIVVDASGAKISDASVTYCVDGGVEQNCYSAGEQFDYECGTEEIGEFTITARKGMYSKSTTVTVEEEFGCSHPDQPTITIKLGG